MLTVSRLNCLSANFYLIEDGLIPFTLKTFDLIFSSFVLLELCKEDIIKYLIEVKRVIKDDGVLIAVTGSQDMYSKKWTSLDSDYSKNKNLKSGDKAKLFVADANMEFIDYYRFFKKAGFSILAGHIP